MIFHALEWWYRAALGWFWSTWRIGQEDWWWHRYTAEPISLDNNSLPFRLVFDFPFVYKQSFCRWAIIVPDYNSCDSRLFVAFATNMLDCNHDFPSRGYLICTGWAKNTPRLTLPLTLVHVICVDFDVWQWWLGTMEVVRGCRDGSIESYIEAEYIYMSGGLFVSAISLVQTFSLTPPMYTLVN